MSNTSLSQFWTPLISPIIPQPPIMDENSPKATFVGNVMIIPARTVKGVKYPKQEIFQRLLRTTPEDREILANLPSGTLIMIAGDSIIWRQRA